MNNEEDPSKKPLLSIVIPSYNKASLLKRLLNSIKKNLEGFFYEVIVTDDNSTDNSVAMVESEFPEFVVLGNKENGLFAINNNRGIKIAQGKYIALLGQDVYFKNNPFKKMIAYMEKYSKVGAMTPKLLYPNEKYQYICRSFPTVKNLFLQTLVDLKIIPNNKTYGQYKMTWISKNQVQNVDQIDASCSLYRRNILKDLNGFDENFPSYFNDVDLCYRIRKNGFKIIYFPESYAIHDHGQSFGKMETKKRLKNWNNGIRQFFLKHYVSSKFSPRYILLNLLLWTRIFAINLAGVHKKEY